jgi:1-acyl-sn-glycerol-3-phosphate acyltransferase
MFPALRLLFVWIALGVPAALIGIPLALVRGHFETMYFWGMGIIKLGLRVAGVKVHVVGVENIPSGRSCIFMSNHVSNLDAPVLLPNVPWMTAVFLKKELMKIPLLGTAMRMGKYVPVSRGHNREDAVRSVEAAKEALAAGLHITVFPEGTRSPDGHLLPFKKGAFFLAAETGAPMVPVALFGTAAMMPKGSLKIVPGEAVVRFLPAIEPAEYSSHEELMKAVRARIEAALEDGPDGAFPAANG